MLSSKWPEKSNLLQAFIVDERVTRSELMNARFAAIDAEIDSSEKRLELTQSKGD